MDSQTAELIALVGELATELEGYGERHWAAWLRKDIASIRAGEEAGLDHLLAAYGGMGSISDLRLCPANGHPIADEHVGAVNASLCRRGMRVYELARALRRTAAATLPATA